MPVPYERTGRRSQKARTREALVTAARELMTRGPAPTVEQAAEAAGISRTTAYRYFPNQRSLVLAAHPQIERESLLPPDAPADPRTRLDLAMTELTRFVVDFEPQLRTSLRLSLDAPGDRPELRRGRAVGWIEDALAPLRDTRPDIDAHRLAVAIRSASGIEALVWLTDIAGLDRAAASAIMRWSATAMLAAALAGVPPPGPDQASDQAGAGPAGQGWTANRPGG